MALYLVHTNDGRTALVQSRNGHRAAEIVGEPEVALQIRRVTEAGPEGILWQSHADEPDGDEEAREVEITDLSDRAGVRRFKNLDTGSIRVEGEAKPRRKSGKSED
jgi:hypothetical protein